MSAPPKPWQLRRRPYTAETTGGTGRDNNARYSPRHSPPAASSSASGGQQQQQLGTPRGLLPTNRPQQAPLPPTNRPQQAPLPPSRGPSVYGGGMYNSYYPRYGYGGGGMTPYSSYGGFGGYSSFTGYRPYGTMYGGFGALGGRDQLGGSHFVQQAEERSRPAFQSVESVVGAVGSVAMMLESTYVAVHSCFRALLGVVEHFSSMRRHLWQILSAISFLRWLGYFLRRLLRALHVKSRQDSHVDAWEETMVSASEVQETSAGTVVVGRRKRSSIWPVVTFWLTVLGIPWLLWKLISHLRAFLNQEEGEEEENSRSRAAWVDDPSAVPCVTLYSYTAVREDELTFEAGQQLMLAPSHLQPHIQGWALAGNNESQGLVPQNYVQPLPPSSLGGVSDTPSHQYGMASGRTEGSQSS